jgi:hypothetical protein
MAIPLIGGLINKVFGVVDKLVPDKDKAKELQHELNQLILGSDLAQMEVNKVEAAHNSLFVAGWRPAVGWTCCLGLAYNFLVYPLLMWAMAIWANEMTPPPALEMGPLMTLLGGMLGFGGLRTFEKLKGVNREK